MPTFENKILFNILIISIEIKSMNYRSRDDIISEILNAANGGGGGLKDQDNL